MCFSSWVAKNQSLKRARRCFINLISLNRDGTKSLTDLKCYNFTAHNLKHLKETSHNIYRLWMDKNIWRAHMRRRFVRAMLTLLPILECSFSLFYLHKNYKQRYQCAPSNSSLFIVELINTVGVKFIKFSIPNYIK